MDKLPLCRICLVINVKMHSIESTPLQKLYETLTGPPFPTKNRRPTQVCYLCHVSLQNCYQLQKDCIRSEAVFSQLPCGPQRSRLQIKHVVQISLGGTNTDTDCEATKDKTTCQIKQETHEASKPDPLKASRLQITKVALISLDGTWDHDAGFEIPIEESPICHLIKQEPDNNMYATEETHDIDNYNIDEHVKTNQYLEENMSMDCAVDEPETIQTNTSREPKETLQLKTKKSLLVNDNFEIKYSEKNPYTCNTCQKSFPCQSHLNRHNRSHTGEKPFQCQICKKKFSYKSNLYTHLREHKGEKLHECDICMKIFFRQSHLIVHYRTHTGEKPYACDECDRKYSRNSDLTVHKRTHNIEKQYQCDVCKKCFSRRNVLVPHIRTHITKKSYQCGVCSKYFKLKSHLDVHNLIHID